MIPISAILPTKGRPKTLAATLDRILSCDPPPAETLVHAGADDAETIQIMRARFPQVRLLVGDGDSGPGGARNALVLACSNEWAASFDDDSHPLDSNFFSRAGAAASLRQEAAVIACALFERDDAPAPPAPPEPSFHRCLEFANGACLWRRSAFLNTRGHVPLKESWCMEEQDVGLQLFAQGQPVLFAPHLRVYHNSIREHHDEAPIAAATLANVALLAYLRYPPGLWAAGLMQVLRRMAWMLKNDRASGILPGLAMLPARCAGHRTDRTPLPFAKVWRYLLLKQGLLPNPRGPGLLPQAAQS